MSAKASIRFLCLIVALFAFVANGAQTHLSFSDSQTVSVPMCHGTTTSMVDLVIGQTPVEEDRSSCCGDCSVGFWAATLPELNARVLELVFTTETLSRPVLVFPRSPLWPGAPPQGPPLGSV